MQISSSSSSEILANSQFSFIIDYKKWGNRGVIIERGDIIDRMSYPSIYEETIQHLENRITIYDHYGLCLETELFKNSRSGIRSVADTKGELCRYDFETSIEPAMKPIYEAQTYDFCIEKKKLLPILEPPSEGEESITEEGEFEPNFQWLVSRLIDSNLLKFDTPEPQKINNGAVSQEWSNTKDLIITGITEKIFISLSNDSCSNFVSSKLQQIPNLTKFRKSQLIFYQGKQSLLLRFKNQVSAQFSYFNIAKRFKTYQQFFGNDIKLGRVTEYKLKEKRDDWVAMVIRKLPSSITKDHLQGLLRKINVKKMWIEEIVRIGDWKYALVGVETLEDVFKTVEHFRNNSSYRELKEIKVNLHPQSKKIWVRAENQMIEEYK